MIVSIHFRRMLVLTAPFLLATLAGGQNNAKSSQFESNKNLVREFYTAEAGKIFASIPNPPQIPGVMAIGGALPIKVGQDVVGAVGVSGAPGGEKDEACAAAGLAKVADKLK